MEKIRTIIADDEFPARSELEFLLEGIDDIQLVGVAEDGIQALELIKEKSPDLVFLDIQMGGKTGLEVAKELMDLELEPIIVFVTAYDEYALDAFTVNAVDYLLKPYEEERLVKLINRIKPLYFKEQAIEEKLTDLIEKIRDKGRISKIEKLAVRTNKGNLKLLEYNDIILLYTHDSKVYVKTYDQEYQIDLSLSELEDRLKQAEFLRVHRSYLINLNKIKEIVPWFKGKYQVLMGDDRQMEVPVSRAKVKDLQKVFGI
ncbi:LytTR family two component transcriptional regulator [Orenia metallireducens]|uniref:Stage 0 sporulation protein A homolog n=1 Tax=Orenia metallireducens TaxID=1413210 RepID=A0A285HDX4_9FIRM|nr:LytTR family DNA-binding domain-containing protein [Orenia metallireducens]PRX27749.1 LytTR family two component transcriptional regulator [Orenia metallireducens]SNY33834.1 two component transcriptional regulator, LytTR family [Orenia metallireducens]